MSDSPDRPSDLSRIFDEFLVKRQLGESPILDEYCQRFPDLAEQLRQHVRLFDALGEAGIVYRHAVELGGRLSGEQGEEEFGCIRVAAFRSYAARMSTDAWQEALARALEQPAPCFMCAETLWWRCHRRLVADRLTVDAWTVTHLFAPGKSEPHALWDTARIENGSLVYDAGTLPIPS